MSDIDALMPAVREFVDAVNERDADVVALCLAFTDPRTLAVLCAGWVGELLDDADDVQGEVLALKAELASLPTDVVGAYRVQKERAERAEERVAELRQLMYREAAARPAGGGKLAA